MGKFLKLALEYLWMHMKNKMAATAIFMLKNAIFKQLVLLICNSNLSIIDILDRYMHLLYTCEPLTLRLFLEGRSGGVKVPHRAIML